MVSLLHPVQPTRAHNGGGCIQKPCLYLEQFLVHLDVTCFCAARFNFLRLVYHRALYRRERRRYLFGLVNAYVAQAKSEA